MKLNDYDLSNGVWSMTNIARTRTWLIVQVWSMLKSKLNSYDQSSKLRSIKKTKQDNDVTDHKGVISIEYDIELSRPNE